MMRRRVGHLRACKKKKKKEKRIRHDFNISVSKVRREMAAADKRYYR